MPTNKNNESILDKQFDIQKLMKGSDSYKSLLYGIVTVVVLFVVIALGIKSLSQNKAQIDNEAAMTQNSAQNTLDNRYEVRDGDSLWSIAQQSYNDGFSWEVIAKANNIKEPYALATGQRLVIPPKALTNAINQTGSENVLAANQASQAPPQQATLTQVKITSSTYTVVQGDDLWDIATRAYGDGYKWSEIAKVNNLSNPNVIHAGNVLTLPRT